MRVSAALVAVSCAACSTTGDSPFFERVSPVSVIDTTPRAGATGVSVDVELTLEFSGDVPGAQAVESAFTLVDLGPPETPVTGLQVALDDRVATVSLPGGAALTLGSTYRAKLDPLLDAQGRLIPTYEWTFQVVDPPPLALLATYPAPATTAPGNFVVRAVFNVDLQASQLGPSPLKLNGGGVGGSSTYDASSRTVTFHPNATANGGITVAFDPANPITDIYGRELVPANWSFTANDTLVDALKPSLSGLVTAAETSAGTITITFAAATDDQWSGSAIRYEALLTQRKPPSLPGCLDPFEPRSVRATAYGATVPIVVSGLVGGAWSVQLDAEDGSGRRSLANGTAGTITLAIGAATYTDVIEPLMGERCALAACHTGSNPPGYVDFTATRQEIVDYLSQTELQLVTPFCLEESYLWHKLTPGFETEGERMPPRSLPESTLSRSEIELFRRWIVEQGGN